MRNQQLPEFYEFASFQLDPQRKRLKNGDEIVSLTPKEFEILFLLVKNAGRVVEKEEILNKVWAETYVEEGTLTRNISWLRKKLAAHSLNDQKIIETLPKRGYRFLPEVKAFGVNDHSAEDISVEDTETSSHEYAAAESDPINDSVLARSNENRFSKLWFLVSALLLAVLVSGVIIYRISVRKDEAKLVVPLKVVPFSGLPGKETSPAFSPDGKQIVYSWDGGIDGANSDIYIKLTDMGEPVRLTTNPANEINPVFSPDGKTIVFLRVLPTNNELIQIPALGGAERKIYDQASYASVSFSPDGKLLALAELDSSHQPTGIFTLDLQTGAKTPLTTPPAPAVDHTPRFSPDGNWLAFIRYFSSFRREIFIVPASGGKPRQITFDDVRIYGLAWGNDSRNLFFTSFRSLNQPNLWQISLADDAEPQLIPTGSKSLESIAIAPDGGTIAFVEETVNENIWEITPNQAPRLLIRSIRADHSPQVSPDGLQIAFASERTGNYEVWLANSDGSNQRKLTDSDGSAGSPRFSPDGKFIAYDTQSAGKSDVFVISVNGGEPHRLTDGDKNNFMPAWSADGQTIFFISNRSGNEQMWKIPAAGGEAAQVTKQGAFEIYAASDGKTLIYSKGSGKPGLWQVGADGENEKPIHELAEVGGWRSWTLANNGVYYTAQNAQPPYQVKFFDFVTRRNNLITSVEKPPLAYYSNLAANGKKLIYAQHDQNSDTIFLAEFEDKSEK